MNKFTGAFEPFSSLGKAILRVIVLCKAAGRVTAVSTIESSGGVTFEDVDIEGH